MTEVAEQAGKILGAVSGTATVWSLDLGLRLGIFDRLAGTSGATADEVADDLDLDRQYTHVVLRAAYAAEVLDLDSGRYRLADHMEELLLNDDSPAYLAGAIKSFVALRETYLDLRQFARDGRREWWSDFDPEWIEAIGENGQVFYRRLLNLVVPKIPSVSEVLVRGGARYLDLACGVCRGPAKIVDAYPSTSVTAVDGDAFTLEQAEREVKERGIGEQFQFVHSMLEDLDIDGGHDLAIINISLHEARDITRVVERAHAALDPGGTFIVSEFPFPEHEEDCRTVPGRLMCGVQFFEAHIGCQLLPSSAFVEHLTNAGFKDVGVIDVTPMHVVIHGTK